MIKKYSTLILATLILAPWATVLVAQRAEAYNTGRTKQTYKKPAYKTKSYSKSRYVRPVARAYVDPAKETSIDRIVVSLFRARVKDKNLARLWYQKRGEYQKAFVTLLNERSYLTAYPINQEFNVFEGPDVISREARTEGVDGVLVGEYLGTSIELALRSGATGRIMVRLTIPIGDLRRTTARDISVMAVNAIVLSFPYRGFVLATQGNEAKLNMGRAEGLTIGTKLEVFKFEGTNPSFYSHTKKTGEMQIIKISNTAAIAKVTSSSEPITPYMKVAFAKTNESEANQSDYRVHSKFWAAVGPEFFYLDTQVSDLNSTKLTQRIYQVPLTPALGLGFGYGRFNFFGIYSALSNASNNVSLIQGTATFQLLTREKNKVSWLTSLGAYASLYNSTPKAGAPFPLVTTQTIAPVVEERFQYTTSPQTKLFAAARLFIPIFSSDAQNGSSSLSSSFGGALEGGVRLDLSRVMAIEGALQTHDLYITMPDGSVNEFEYGFYAHLLFLF